MSNPPRVKGTRAESAAARWLTGELGVEITRGPLRGNQDCGDLFGVPDWTIEVKNCKTPDLKGWGRELSAECRNAGTAHGVVMWSPPGVGMGNVDRWIALEWYYEEFATQPGRVVPHIGPLSGLHKYVATMQTYGYATGVWSLVPSQLVIARWAENWLAEMRERIAAA